MAFGVPKPPGEVLPEGERQGLRDLKPASMCSTRSASMFSCLTTSRCLLLMSTRISIRAAIRGSCRDSRDSRDAIRLFGGIKAHGCLHSSFASGHGLPLSSASAKFERTKSGDREFIEYQSIHTVNIGGHAIIVPKR